MSHHRHTAPLAYEIRIAGTLAPERVSWFGQLELCIEHGTNGTAITVLSGPVADGAALFGILNRVRDLGMTLISVKAIAFALHARDESQAAGEDVQQKEGNKSEQQG